MQEKSEKKGEFSTHILSKQIFNVKLKKR